MKRWTRFKKWVVRRTQRFFGFEKVSELIITVSVLDDLSEMARGAHPKEMVAFMSATRGVEKGVLTIDEIQLQAYEASHYSTSFNLWQLPTLTSIIGTVHSHPSSNTRPSNQDLKLFGQYGLVHAIIGYPYNHDSIVFYDKQGRRVPVRVID